MGDMAEYTLNCLPDEEDDGPDGLGDNHHWEERKLEDVPDTCYLCRGGMVIKTGKHGAFAGCGNYPDCPGVTYKVPDGTLLGPIKQVRRDTERNKHRRGELVLQPVADGYAPLVYTDGQLSIIHNSTIDVAPVETIHWEFQPDGVNYCYMSNDGFDDKEKALKDVIAQLKLTGPYRFISRTER